MQIREKIMSISQKKTKLTKKALNVWLQIVLSTMIIAEFIFIVSSPFFKKGFF